jgi:hypothetical protein
MHGAIPPLKYAFMAWFSVKNAKGQLYLFIEFEDPVLYSHQLTTGPHMSQWNTFHTSHAIFKIHLNMKHPSTSGFDSEQRQGFLFFTITSRAVLRPTQPTIQLVSGALSLGVKRSSSGADHSPSSSAEVKNAWSYTSTPHMT